MLNFKYIAEETRAARAKKDWTQEELARRMDVHRMTVSRAEDGRPVSRCTIRRIERAFGFDRDHLIEAGSRKP